MNRLKNQQRLSPGVTRGITALGLISALVCAAPAMAATITFETLPASAHESGTSVSASGYNMLFVEGAYGADFGVVSGIGTILNAGDPDSCFITGCPAGASGNYLAILNDGAVQFTQTSQAGGFNVHGLNFAFVAPAPVGPGNYGQLQLAGVRWDGSVVSTALDFPGQDDNGSFMFGSAMLDAGFRAQVFKSLTVNACIYDMDQVCSNSLASPAFNQAQFALDNIALNDVPEPASFLLFGLGIGALGLSRRRAARKAASPVTL